MNNDPISGNGPIPNTKAVDVPKSEPVAVPESPQGPEETAVDPSASTPLSVKPEGFRDVLSTPLPDAENAAPELRSASGSTAPRKSSRPRNRPKAEIETLEQYIEYAYGRRGQRAALKPQAERQAARSPRLDDAARSRLLDVARADVLLAVPRQLLLVSRDIQKFPALRAELISFVSTVMQKHPAFMEEEVQAFLHNITGGQLAIDAVSKLTEFTPVPGKDTDPLKYADLQTLRRNAVQLLVTWMAVNRGIDFDELSTLLFQALWLPAAREIPDDNERLRALTEIEHAGGVGVACQRFSQQATEARTQKDHAQREAAELRERLAESEARLALAEAQIDTLQTKLKLLEAKSRVEVELLRQQGSIEKTHLQHDLDQLRGRVVKRLTDSVDMLEVGLSALRKEAPRVPVMLERAEHVVDALQAEIRAMKEE